MEENVDLEILRENQVDSEDLQNIDPSDVIVYARDWTIQTIIGQINAGNIDLNPGFQRRNAWNDNKRSKLIESIIMGYPIPEIVLAEDPNKKRSFIVIDGKQRLLTIAGFMNNEQYKYWNKPIISNLNVHRELNKKGYSDFDETSKREFDNSSLRCTVITNFKDIQVLYDIFYRLNSGSESLSTQELRQALNKGEFADYLVYITEHLQPIHYVMNLSNPDNRFRDIENLLRLFSFILYAHDYKGNLRKFLDEKMQYINNNWLKLSTKIKNIYNEINNTINLLKSVYDEYTLIGRKYETTGYVKRFNRVLFEVEMYYFRHLDDSILKNKDRYISGFKNLCISDSAFMDSIESSTKSIENYKIRYCKFEQLINESFDVDLHINPFC